MADLPVKRSLGQILLAAVLVLFGAVLVAGGAWLAALGGSWYYVLAGIGCMFAGIGLARRRRWAATWFGATFVGTLAWTIWESGLDYWGWVPRFALMLVLAIAFALQLPKLGFGKTVSRAMAGVFTAGFLVAAGLAFVPYHVTEAREVSQAGRDSFIADTGSGDASKPANGDWYAYGRDLSAQRFAPQAQITPDNVKKLKLAWSYRTGDLPRERWGGENTPIKVGNLVYVCTPHNIAIALDAATGSEKWRYDPKVDDHSIPYTAACRGLTYFRRPHQQPPERRRRVVAAMRQAHHSGHAGRARDRTGC